MAPHVTFVCRCVLYIAGESEKHSDDIKQEDEAHGPHYEDISPPVSPPAPPSSPSEQPTVSTPPTHSDLETSHCLQRTKQIFRQPSIYEPSEEIAELPIDLSLTKTETEKKLEKQLNELCPE